MMMETCSEQRIRQFLSHELSSLEEQHLEQHLSTCETCCQQLQESTAEIAWWNDASELLPDQEHDLEPLTLVLDKKLDASHKSTAEPPHAGAIQNVLQLLAPTDDPNMLGRLGGYEIVGVIGAGGMSVVLKAFDRSLNRYVAMKVLAPHLATSGAARMRFAREAQAAAAIVHENVIAIHGVDEAQGLPYLVMPYVRGDSLQRRLDREGSLALEEILRIAMQTAAGLEAAHAQGLVHRDVKPANILLADGVERVTITDFGLARAADDASLTRSGMIAGTPQYMSPEQARGETIDQRSDLFSLGSVIYAMCTGRPPFRSESSYGVLRRISDTQPRPIQEVNHNIPNWLSRLVQRLHAKLPAERYTSAAEVATELEQCLAHVQQPAREPLPASLIAAPPRNSWYFAGFAAIVLAMTGTTLFLTWPDSEPGQAAAKSSTKDDSGETASPIPLVESPTPQDSPRVQDESHWGDDIEQDLFHAELELQALEAELTE